MKTREQLETQRAKLLPMANSRWTPGESLVTSADRETARNLVDTLTWVLEADRPWVQMLSAED